MTASCTHLKSKDRRWFALCISAGIHGVLLYLALVSAGLNVTPTSDTSDTSSLTLILPIVSQRQAELHEYPIEGKNHIAESDIQNPKSKTGHPPENSDRNISAENKTNHSQPASASAGESHDIYSEEAKNEIQPQNTAQQNDITTNSTEPHIATTDKKSEAPLAEQAAKPDYLYNPSPGYPMSLKEKGIGGTVWLKVWVSANGIPEEVSLLKGSGYRLLDESAIKAIKNWRFFPAKANGLAIGSWVEFPIRFAT